jgi:hypothetical protein
LLAASSIRRDFQPAMSNHTATTPRWLSWNGLVYYGETVGFLAAWVAGIAVLSYSVGTPEPRQPNVKQVAAVSEQPIR